MTAANVAQWSADEAARAARLWQEHIGDFYDGAEPPTAVKNHALKIIARALARDFENVFNRLHRYGPSFASARHLEDVAHAPPASGRPAYADGRAVWRSAARILRARSQACGSGAMMFQRVTRLKHAFGDPVNVAADPPRGRHQQTERHCSKCALVKITVHPPMGEGWREWRWDDAPTQFADRQEPECIE